MSIPDQSNACEGLRYIGIREQNTAILGEETAVPVQSGQRSGTQHSGISGAWGNPLRLGTGEEPGLLLAHTALSVNQQRFLSLWVKAVLLVSGGLAKFPSSFTSFLL